MRRIDTDSIIQSYDLRDFILEDLSINPVYRTKDYIKIKSPLRPEERTASFVIWADHWHDYGTREHGNIFHYLQRTRNFTFMEAVRYLNGDDRFVKMRRDNKPPHSKNKKRITSMPLDTLHEYEKNINSVTEYLSSRLISDDVVKKNRLGASINLRHTYRSTSGLIHRFPVQRVTLPQFIGDALLTINFRRDDVYCWKFIRDKNIDIEFFRKDIARQLNVKTKEVTDKDILDFLFGSRFLKLRGGQSFLFAAEQIIKIEDGKYRPKQVPVVFADEGEFNALSILDCGYPAVAMNSFSHLNIERIFSGVSYIVVPVHNDETCVNPANSSEFNAGIEYLNRLKRMFKNPRKVRPMYLPKDFKDANEMHVAGELKKYIERII